MKSWLAWQWWQNGREGETNRRWLEEGKQNGRSGSVKRETGETLKEEWRRKRGK